MLNSTDELLAREHYSERLRAVEHEQLVQQALQARRGDQPLYGPALAWLGRQLSNSGQRLLTRYSRSDAGCTSALPN